MKTSRQNRFFCHTKHTQTQALQRSTPCFLVLGTIGLLFMVWSVGCGQHNDIQCTNAENCTGNEQCIDGQCVDESNNNNNNNGNNNNNNNNNNGGNNNNNNNNNNSGSLGTLPTSTFVYVKYPRPGVGHLYTYDVKTKKSTLLSVLDDDGKLGTKTPRVSISPDRKWIALKALFRPSKADFETGLATPMIWKISANGKDFKRVSDTIPGPKGGTPCSSNAQCTGGYECNTAAGQCRLPNYRITLGQPRWSRDGKTIWTTQGQYWNSGGRISGGVVPASVSADGGVLTLHTVTTGCAQVSHVSPSTAADELVAVHSVCSGSSRPGLYRYQIPPKQAEALVVDANFEVSLSTPIWVTTLKRLVYKGTTTWDTTGDGKPNVRGEGLILYDLATKKQAPLLSPLTQPELSYQDFAISPDGNFLAVCLFNNKTNANNLLLLDASDPNKPKTEALTTDGKSCNPAW